MMRRLWSEACDARLRRLVAEDRSWADIGVELHAPAAWLAARCDVIGAFRRRAPRPPVLDDSRQALPPGHDRTWSAITDQTLLHGRPYPLPVFSSPSL